MSANRFIGFNASNQLNFLAPYCPQGERGLLVAEYTHCGQLLHLLSQWQQTNNVAKRFSLKSRI